MRGAAAPDEPAGWQPQHSTAGRVPWAGHQVTLGKGRDGRLATRNRAACNARCALVAAREDVPGGCRRGIADRLTNGRAAAAIS
jgi:hypothetical protein